jgi:murein DD-endopeptidase MepM/ murein hydrolase activator NlpD
MMVPESMLMHAQAMGLPVEAIPAHIKPEDLLLSAANFTAAGNVKLCEPAFAKMRTSPFGGALSFHAGADADDPLRGAAVLAISLGLDSTLSATKAA